ncbi:hypothetical protein NEMIN01_0187 [Nematocida minor]|uniref:uncharacterized protein n=1 Tax=Nematocida minor TaxID=1912983 RepID=UPI00221F1EB5|nr:uncharacterized protein NEMIN01_0083 [Nematocida minor]XP_051332089.1 uncharacterized protein NEMIN01_0187 [Nematocida minor]KAI5188819.1 hypothetical protein NEMIN01_0083 [Nematocida minor]KAI5188923.1 hypothetical protein NEMIN01_0187 [Nematocida minor]
MKQGHEKKSYLKIKKESPVEEYPEKHSPKDVYFLANEDSAETQMAAQAIVSIRRTEVEKERKEKNRIAAKRSREKKMHYMQDIEHRLYFENSKNQKLLQHIDTLYALLEKILLETESLLADKKTEVSEMAYIFVRYDEYFNFPFQHKSIIDSLRYLLFSSNKSSDI